MRVILPSPHCLTKLKTIARAARRLSASFVQVVCRRTNKTSHRIDFIRQQTHYSSERKSAMDRVDGKLVEGTFVRAEKSVHQQTKQQSIHPFNRSNQLQQASRFSQDEESVWSCDQNTDANERFMAMHGDTDNCCLQEQDTREDRHHFESESDEHLARVSVDPPSTNKTKQLSPVSSPKNTDPHDKGVTLAHESIVPPSPRNNLFESRAARVARLKHIRPKPVHQSKNNPSEEAVSPDRDESDALSQCSFDIKKRLESSPLHKMMQQKRPQRTISVSPPRSRDANPMSSENPERMTEKLRRIARSQSPAPKRAGVAVAYTPMTSELEPSKKGHDTSADTTSERAHPVFGYTKNTVKSGTNSSSNSSRDAASKTPSPPTRIQRSGPTATVHSSRNNGGTTQSSELYDNFSNRLQSPPNVSPQWLENALASSTRHPKRNEEYLGGDVERSSDLGRLAERFPEQLKIADQSPHITTRKKKVFSTSQNQEYHMFELKNDPLVPYPKTQTASEKSVYLDPTLMEVGMSDESSISTISHKFSADAERRDMAGYQTQEMARGEFQLKPEQKLSNDALYKLQKTSGEWNQMTKKIDEGDKNAYNPARMERKEDRNALRADDDIFDGLDEDTLPNDTIFRFADEDDGYNQKHPIESKHPKQTTKSQSRAPSTYFSRVAGGYGRSGMVVEGSRANKSVISDITSDLKSKRHREYRRKDYTGGEVATIDENTANDTVSYVDRADVTGSHTVDETLEYTVEEETEYQDSYEDESVNDFNTQECTKETILESTFYKMGCAVVSTLTSALSSQDVINQICQDPRSLSQLQTEKKVCSNFKCIDGMSGGKSKQEDKTLQQVVRELADSSDHSVTDSATKRKRQDEERKQAQSKLFEYANQAMGRLPSTRRRPPQVLQPILSQTSYNGQGETGSAFSISAAGDKASSDHSSILSEVQTKALTEISASLRNEGVKALKLNRHKKWQVRYLKVSQEGKVNTKCPKALLWLKNPSASATKLPDGQGGFLFSKLTSIEALQNTTLLDNLPKNLRKDFPSLQVVALDYECDEGPRQVIISFRNSTEAEAFCSAIGVIKLWAQRESSVTPPT